MRPQAIAPLLLSTLTAAAGINPFTLTSLTEAQASAFLEVQASLLSSFAPQLTSVIAELATDSTALAAFTSLGAQLGGAAIPTGTAVLSDLDSILSLLPSNVQGVYRSLVSAEVTALSTIVNNIQTTGSSGASSTSKSGSGSVSTSTSTSTSAFASAPGSSSSASGKSANAAPTSGFFKAAGMAVGAFGAAVVLL